MRPAKLQSRIEAINGAQFELNASLFKPEGASSGIAFFCLPGGGASQDYFDLGQYGGFDYSFVSRMTALGHTIITMDHPGTGGNLLPDQHPFLKPREASDYIAAAWRGVLEQAGLQDMRAIGLGHSMGGMATVLTQARHRLFAAIALLGSSAGGLDWALDDHEKAYIGKADAIEEDLEELVLRKFPSAFPPPLGGPSGKSITFGGANPEVTQRLREITTSLYAAGGSMAMIKGSFLKEAETIDVPIFFAFGDHDIGVPPEEAPAPFKGTSTKQLLVLENCGHNSFAFPVIETLCAKLDSWAREV